MKTILFITLITALLYGGPIEDLNPGEWYEVPNSHMLDVAFQWPSGVTYTRNGIGVKGVMNVWSGGAYDTKRDRLIVWGGGHSAYAGNEIYVFDLNNLAWERVNDPSIPVADDTPYAPDGGPCSRHTYNYIQYVSVIDRFCTFGGAGFYDSGQTGTSHTDCFDFDSGKWEKKADATSSGIGALSAIDPSTGHAWVKRNNRSALSEWDPVNNKWTAYNSEGNGYYHTADIVDKTLVTVGNGSVLTWDLNNPTAGATTLTTTGPQDVVNKGNPGFVYNPNIKKFIGWIGGADVYSFDLDSKTWAKHSPSPSNTVIPTAANDNGTYGRFRYVPSRDVFIVVNSVEENVFIYRLPSNLSSVKQSQKIENKAEIVVLPNPFRSITKIAVSYQPSAISQKTVPIKIFNVNGKMVKKLKADSRQLIAGIPWNASALPAGIYVLKVKIGNKILTQRLLLTK